MSQTIGSIFMIVTPSGADKSNLVNAILKEDSEIVLSISCTTRTPRPGEENDKHYRFVTPEEFMRMRDNDALLEWAEVHGNFYGTPRDRVDQAVHEGKDVILEID